ncbi:SafA/ExsA family spore coat assembly protein [Brevibacillus sp. SYSU BS000544]|uniref:SafA/ExsA family spore coat assembly protein n=1 Tax=Brevibacillus sp. SYSU BS000544 TaxID=3416443 RepID=UPI003CE5BD28
MSKQPMGAYHGMEFTREEIDYVKIHTVQKGDTLWKIAKQYNVDFKELLRVNSQIKNPDRIMPGMKVKIPSAQVPLRSYGNPGHSGNPRHSGNPGPGNNRPAKKEFPITPPQMEMEIEELPPLLEELELPPVKEAPIPQMPMQPAPQPAPQPPMQPQIQFQPQIQIQPPPQPPMQPQIQFQPPPQPPMQPQIHLQMPPMQPQFHLQMPQMPMQPMPQPQMQPPRQFFFQIQPRLNVPMPMMPCQPCQPGPMPHIQPLCPPVPHAPHHQSHGQSTYDCSTSSEYHAMYPSSTYPSQTYPSSSYHGSTYHSPIFPITTGQSSSGYQHHHPVRKESSSREMKESSCHEMRDSSTGDSSGECHDGCSGRSMDQPMRQHPTMHSLLHQPYHHHSSSSSTHLHVTPHMHSPMYHLHQPMPFMPGHEVSPCWDDGFDWSSSGD